MIRGFARLGDVTHGTCSHPDHQNDQQPYEVAGKITTASSDVFVNFRRVARYGDTVTADCGHIGKIISGSNNIAVNAKILARLGDHVGDDDYTATIVSASPNTDTNI